jgi:tetratricopeptide (TPR) repeat protein
MVSRGKRGLFIWLLVLAGGCATTPPPKPVASSPPVPSYYGDALKAYWSENNSTAFVFAVLAVEKEADDRHAAHAAYLVDVLASEKLSAAQLDETLRDPRIAPLMLDIYVRGLGALKTNDAPLAYRAFRDFTLATPSERWRVMGLKRVAPVGWGPPPSVGEIDQNLRLAELTLNSASDVTQAGQIADTVGGPATKAQRIRAAQIMTAVFERTGDSSWAEKAFVRCLETQQRDTAENLAQRILTNESATVGTYVSVGLGYARAGQTEAATKVLAAAKTRFGDRYAELSLAQVELYRRQQRYDDALQELLRAGREVEAFRREHYHPVWAKRIEAAGLATGPDDSVFAITGDDRPRVLRVNRDGEVVGEYGPFEDPGDDGTHPFAVFKDGTFLIRNGRWSSDGRLLKEFPFSSAVWAVSITRDQRVIVVGREEGIKVFSPEGEEQLHLCGDRNAWPCQNCPCRGIVLGETLIQVITRQGLVRMDQKGNFFGPWDGPWTRSVAAGRDEIFYVTGKNQTKVFRTFPQGGRDFEDTLPCGGSAVAGGTSGGFYVAGVATESGAWLVKFAPPVVLRD